MSAMRAARFMFAAAAAVAIAATATMGCNAGPVDIATLSPTSVAAGLVGHWTFDEGAGTEVRDTSGNERKGTDLRCRLDLDDGQVQRGVAVGGGDQVAVGGGFGFPSRPATTACRPGCASPRPMCSRRSAAILSNESRGRGPAGRVFAEPGHAGPGQIGEVANYHFEYWIGDSVTSMDMARVQCDCVELDAWTHLAVVVNATAKTLTFYTNGVRAPAGQRAQEHRHRRAHAVHGAMAADADAPLSGTLDDVAIYARALVPEEVALLSRVQAPDPF